MGIDLTHLNGQLDILRLGMGPEKTMTSLVNLPEAQSYDLIIHFGVSGSLSETFGVQTIVRGQRFLYKNKPSINLPRVNLLATESLPEATFLTVLSPITDEGSRLKALTTGAHAVDMESYPMVTFCMKKDIPLLSIRCISDRAGDSTAKDFKKHYKAAAHKLQSFLLNHYLTEIKIST